jgi:hypothetical protein
MKTSFWKKSVRLKRISFRNAFLSLLGFSLPLGLGIYNRSVDDGEGYHQFYTFPKATARPVTMTYGGDGILHRLVSPHMIGGTLGLTNVGRPVRVGMRMAGVPEGLTIQWGNSYTRDFDLNTKTVERILRRGDSISVHHTFYIGRSIRQKPVIFKGGLEIFDLATGKSLLTIPIRIRNASIPVSQPRGRSAYGY